MKLLRNQEIEVDAWQALLYASSFASPFQSPGFYRMIDAVPGFSAEVFAVEEDGQLQALLLLVIQKENGLKSYFSRRGIVYGGPIILSEDQEVMQFLLKETTKALKHKVIYLETRNFFDYSRLSQCFKRENWEYLPYVNYQIWSSEKNMASLLSAMKYNRRREIKQSLKNGATYRESSSEKEVTELYAILQELYSTRVKLPLPALSFFIQFLYAENARVFVAEYETAIISGCFCLFLPGRNLFTMYYCGIREMEKKIYPTSLAVFAAIHFAASNKIPVVDLMGAGKPEKDYGVRDYKSQFGGELVEHGRYLKILNRPLYKLGNAYVKTIVKLKS